ncbi:S-adenosyl-L-methionine-dependent methyltransferase [Aaosphaeria arxii CBS 175.79]|uniref:S-adenosyl-L-methionine-dependent methyltransferase n=1 Tax=Aaosphaeria arxii CBS 175.79 TaxID=1450172 RepID=A0A6A5XM45_9PLEO|nr:S-adenosyl-L-methionine-dependent methyltransferase [Aaosphaeria arxii CBS 175.79]KAF2013881.1 S-adenosyl-L-methionine-dependent methyltransferase [Aaosphaeria arxii CBS 175.79]
MATPSVKNTTQIAWSDPAIAQKYARAEKASGPFAEVMIQRSDIKNTPAGQELNVLDLACGTGAVTKAMYDALPREQWDATKVLGADISEPMLSYLKERGEKEGWKGLETRVVDLNDTKLAPTTYTHLFLNFAVFLSPPTVLQDLSKLLRPNAFISVSTWLHMPWYHLAARAASRVASAPPFPSERAIEDVMYSKRPWNSPEYLAQALADAGVADVQTTREEREVDCGTPDEFCDTMFMVLKLIRVAWLQGVPEEEAEKFAGSFAAKLRDVAGEEAEGGRGDGHVWMWFRATVGSGRKAS